MNGGHETIYGLVREILDDCNISWEMQLPTLSTLRVRSWSEPLVFVYGGDSWPSAIYPCHLLEVNRSFFFVTPLATQQCVSSVSEHSNGSSRVSGLPCHFVQTSRFEVVGTVFSIESYQLFARCDQRGTLSVRLESDKPLGFIVVRVITNECGIPHDAKTTAARLAQFSNEQLRHVFFCTLTPLVGISFDQLEKKWYSCVTASFSQDEGGECGVVCSNKRSNQCCDEKASFPLSNASVEFVGATGTTKLNSPLNVRCEKMNDNGFITCERLRATKTFTDFSLRWSIFLCIFGKEERCRLDVAKSWARWTNGWSAVSRSSVVDSIDDIITSLGGSRVAAHAAAAFFDAFICVSQTVVRDPTYFSGVLLACAMLGCKEVDRFFPPIKSFLRCLRSDFRITEAEFLRYEMHVFEALDFRLQHFTTLEAVESLLHLCGGPAALGYAERQHRKRELVRWTGNADSFCCCCNNDSVNNSTIDGNCGSGCDGSFYSCPTGSSSDAVALAGILRWDKLCTLARFFTDVMCRHTTAQEYHHTTLGLAIIAVAAERARWTLPAPLTDILPSSHRAAVDGGTRAELDNDSYELLTRYAAVVRRRCEQESQVGGTTSELGRAIKLVWECCGEFFLGRRKVEGVLQRRYKMTFASE